MNVEEYIQKVMHQIRFGEYEGHTRPLQGRKQPLEGRYKQALGTSDGPTGGTYVRDGPILRPLSGRNLRQRGTFSHDLGEREDAALAEEL